MLRNFKALFLLILFILPLCNLFAISEDFSFVQNGKNVNLTTVLKTGNTKMLFSLSQDENGYFNLKSPSAFSIDIRETLKFGELKPDGVLLMLLKPENLTSTATGFREQRFDSISTPAINADYIGVAIPFTDFDIFALNTNSLGFGINAGTHNAFFSFLVNDSANQFEIPDKYQIDWQSYTGNYSSVSMLAGANSSFKVSSLTADTQVFIREIKDKISKPEYSTGIDLILKHNRNRIILRKRQGSFGEILYVSLKGSNFEYSVKDSTGLENIYNGLYQERKLKSVAKFKFNGFELRNDTDYTRTKTGKENTDCEISISWKNNGRLYRLVKDSEDLKLVFSDDYIRLIKTSDSLDLEFTFAVKFSEKLNAKLIIDNERQLTAALHYKDL